MADILRQLFVENPMLDEVSRARRRFLRGGMERPIVNYAMLGIVSICYLWLLADIFRYREDFATALLVVALIVITLVAPAVTYGAIAGERERATWDALILTRLTPAQIVAGKLTWRTGLLALLIVILLIPAAISRTAATHPDDIPNQALLMGLLQVVAWGVFLSAFGLWISSLSRRSVTALAVIAGTMFVVLALAPMLIAIFGSELDSAGSMGFDGKPVPWFFYHINPFIALSSLTEQSSSSNTMNGGVHLAEIMWGLVPTLFFVIVAILCILLTHMRLRGLEEPRRR